MTETHEFDLPTTASAFWRGISHVPRAPTGYALAGGFFAIGALAHDTHLSIGLTLVLNVLVWAGPAQLILLTMLGAGAPLLQIAIAVSLSGVRLFPMVASVLPTIRAPETNRLQLLLPAHFTAVTFMIESQRIMSRVPRRRRVAFCNGFGLGLMVTSTLATIGGFLLAGNLPPLFAVGILFLTPVVFLLSTASGCRTVADWLALGLGLALMPVAALANTGLDLLISGLGAGTIAYAVERWRRRA